MKRIVATLFALVGIFSVLVIVYVLLSCVDELVRNGPCGTPLASLLLAIIVYFPTMLWTAYRGWKFSQKNSIFPGAFRRLFVFTRALCIASAIVGVIIWCRLYSLL
jgi:hypothetical protein